MSSNTPQADTHVKADRFSKDVPWYQKEVQNFSPAGRELLEKYSHIPPDEVDAHVHAIRERAWTVVPYPCIGMWRFLNLSISAQPCYPRILSLLKEPQSQYKFLDLGCCFAQDLRKLVHDGAPSENLYGSDLDQSFLDLSYDLFKDKDTLKSHLFQANALDEHGPMDNLEGKMDVIYAGSFLHLFSWDDQLKACKAMIKILKPQKGSMVFGRQTGNVKGQEVVRRMLKFDHSGGAPLWRHDVESFTKLWDLAGSETGTKWKTWGTLDEAEEMGSGHWGEKGIRQLKFEVERVE